MKTDKLHYSLLEKADLINQVIPDQAASDLIAHGLDMLTFEQIKALVPVLRQISRGKD